MYFERAVSRALHEEHMATLILLGRLDKLVAQNGADEPPDCTAADVRMLLGDLKAAIRSEVKAHFAFEETSLFPLLRQAGADDMNGILHDEHEVLLPLGDEIADGADVAIRSGFTPQAWARFRTAAGRFVDGLREHVDKEEAGFVPMIEDLLSDAADEALIRAYKF